MTEPSEVSGSLRSDFCVSPAAAFAAEPALTAILMPKLGSRHYDPLMRPWRENDLLAVLLEHLT